MKYVVTYAIDHLDPKPDQWEFDTEHEAIDFLHEEIARRVSHLIAHSPYSFSEEEYAGLHETEVSLCRIDAIEKD